MPALRDVPHPRGRATTIHATDLKAKGYYTVMEADDLIPSHNAETFEPDPRQPVDANGRTYQGKQGQTDRETTINIGNTLDPDRALDPARSALVGPGIIDRQGRAFGGNGRIMATQRAYAADNPGSRAYRAQLIRDAAEYGLDPAQVAGMRQPVLVRVVDDPTFDLNNADTRRAINRATDTEEAKARSVLGDAQVRADRLRARPETLDYLTTELDPEESLAEHLERKGPAFWSWLERSGVVTRAEIGRFYDAASGRTTEPGKDMAQKMLALIAIPDRDAVYAAPASAIRKITPAKPVIAAANTRPEWSLASPMSEAMHLLGAVRKGKAGTVLGHLAQGDLMGRTFGERAQVLAHLVETERQGALVERFRKYAEATASAERMGQSDSLFGDQPETPQQAFDRIFGQLPDRNASPAERRVEESAAVTYGSDRTASRVAQQVAEVAGDLADGSVNGLPTSAERLRQIRGQGRLRARVDVRGQKLTSHNAIRSLLAPFRSPFAERLHAILLDAKGRILSHVMESSGAIDYSLASSRMLKRLNKRVRRLGATEVVLAHNHPSGDVTPQASRATSA